ncbi:hypothetical protein KR222_002480, partial [Zaprionus bogoriensis]
IPIIYWLNDSSLHCQSHVTFTNLKCSFRNVTFGEYTECSIKAVNRTHKYISLYGRLYYQPIDNVIVNFKFMHYDNGHYKPFFIDTTFDGCKFLRNQRDPIIRAFFKIIKDRSNVNHTCPFNHDIVVNKLWTGNLESDFLKYVPIPSGDYALFLTFYSNKMKHSFVNTYIRISS